MGNSSERLGLRSSEFKTWTFGRLEKSLQKRISQQTLRGGLGDTKDFQPEKWAHRKNIAPGIHGHQSSSDIPITQGAPHSKQWWHRV